jgi:hypothetical protein
MTGTASTGAARAPAVVDGVDVDAVAAAAQSCPAVDRLCSGAWGGVVSYLRGREVAGVRATRDHIVVSVRSQWGVPAAEVARQVRTVLAPLAGPRRIDVVMADVADPPATLAQQRTGRPFAHGRASAPAMAGDPASGPRWRPSAGCG